jgi:Cytochrome c554 and c-prime
MPRMKKTSALVVRALPIAALVGTVLLFTAWHEGKVPVAHAFHTHEELEVFERGAGLPIGENTYFKTSFACNGCHGHDPTGFAMVTTEGGVDVNVVDDWRSTMMANSAKDPFWRAKVSHEVQVNPGHQVGLEDKCTSCHAPAGRHDKHMLGHGPYSIAELGSDPNGIDGVSCVPCHIQSADSIGLLFSGNLKFDTLNRPLYGPFSNVFGAPMASFVGYEPMYGAHINDAGLCAGCHTLVTGTADLSGNPTGGEFFEQATYHEWLNSKFNTDEHPLEGITCQGCHVPRIADGVVLSANYLFLQPKSPFGLHQFAGANTFVLELLKNNRLELGLFANETQFDSTINRTERMLRSGLLVEANMAYRDADTSFINVKLDNLAGHKFPSGYPARRAWVELTVTNASGDTIFRSGGWNSAYEVIGHDAQWEPHYDVISAPGQAQIYEMVMADVNGNKTTVLERAASKLKDNRLAPELFTTTHYTYDTATIANVLGSDIDFNHDALGVEGSGSDIVHYHVPMNGYVGLVNVSAKVWYQSSPPKWMEEMFAYNSAEIDTFRTLYQEADNSPFLVQESVFDDLSVGFDDLAETGVRILPNPVMDGQLNVTGLTDRVLGVEVYDIGGKRLASSGRVVGTQWRMRLPEGAATYLLLVHTASRTFVERIVSLR